MSDGADSLCGPLNHRKWLPVHLWEYKQHCQVGLSEPVMGALYADDATISLMLVDTMFLGAIFTLHAFNSSAVPLLNDEHCLNFPLYIITTMNTNHVHFLRHDQLTGASGERVRTRIMYGRR